MQLKVRMLLPLIVSSWGCYAYVPTTVDAVSEGSHVRAVITTERQEALRGEIGIIESPMAGQVIQKRSDRLLLSVRAASTDAEFGSRSLYQRVEIPDEDVLRVDERQVSPAKTAGIVAVTSGGAVVLMAVVFGGESVAGSGSGGGGLPPESVTGWLPRLPVVP